MLEPFYKLNVPQIPLLNPQFQADNLGQEYFTQIYRFADPSKFPNRAIPGKHTVNNETIFCAIEDVIDREFIRLLDDLSVLGQRDNRGSLFMFYHRPQGRPGPIHCDWGPQDRANFRQHWAINWTTCTNTDQTMSWYRPNDPRVNELGHPVDAGYMNAWSSIPEFEPQYVTKIAETSITTATLVRTDIPHNAQNHGQEVRWCFSLRGRMSASWEEAVAWFKPLIQ